MKKYFFIFISVSVAGGVIFLLPAEKVQAQNITPEIMKVLENAFTPEAINPCRGKTFSECGIVLDNAVRNKDDKALAAFKVFVDATLQKAGLGAEAERTWNAILQTSNQQTASPQPPAEYRPVPPPLAKGPRAWQWVDEQRQKLHTPPGMTPGEEWEWEETDFEEWAGAVEGVLLALQNPPAYVMKAMKTKRGTSTRVGKEIFKLTKHTTRKLRELKQELARHQQEEKEEETQSQNEAVYDKLNDIREVSRIAQSGPYDTVQTLMEKKQKVETALARLQELLNSVPAGSQIAQEIKNEISNLQQHMLRYLNENIERMNQPQPAETQPQPLQGNIFRIVNSNSPLRAFHYFLKILNR